MVTVLVNIFGIVLLALPVLGAAFISCKEGHNFCEAIVKIFSRPPPPGNPALFGGVSFWLLPVPRAGRYWPMWFLKTVFSIRMAAYPSS